MGLQARHGFRSRQPGLRAYQDEHARLVPAGQPEDVDQRLLGADRPEPDHRLQLARGVAQQEPSDQGVRRHMIFFKCAMKTEKKNCAKAQMYKWLTFLYGNSDEFDWSAAGFPTDKYDRAALSMMVQAEAQTDEEKFIGQFFTQDLHM